jgi:hypothetical protein
MEWISSYTSIFTINFIPLLKYLFYSAPSYSTSFNFTLFHSIIIHRSKQTCNLTKRIQDEVILHPFIHPSKRQPKIKFLFVQQKTYFLIKTVAPFSSTTEIVTNVYDTKFGVTSFDKTSGNKVFCFSFIFYWFWFLSSKTPFSSKPPNHFSLSYITILFFNVKPPKNHFELIYQRERKK